MFTVYINCRGKWMAWVGRKTLTEALKMSQRLKNRSWRIVNWGNVVARSVDTLPAPVNWELKPFVSFGSSS